MKELIKAFNTNLQWKFCNWIMRRSVWCAKKFKETGNRNFLNAWWYFFRAALIACPDQEAKEMAVSKLEKAFQV